jgi:hypothetical protein
MITSIDATHTTKILLLSRSLFHCFLMALLYLSQSQSLRAQDTVNGVLWYPPIQLSESAYNAFIPSIALSGDDTIHFTWHQGYPVRLPYRRSTDGGVSFEPTREMILDSSFTTGFANRPKVLATSGRLFIIFGNNDLSKLRMFRSLDAGTNFDSMKEISPYLGVYMESGAILGDTLAIIYPADNGVSLLGEKLLYSTNRGETWSERNEIISGFDDAQVTITPGYFHLTKHYDTGTTLEVLYQRSTNLGLSWSVDTILSVIDWNYSDIPTIAAHQTECGSEVQVLWRDTKYGAIGGFGASVIRRMSIDGGVHWTPEEVLTTIPDGSYPLASISDKIHAITWWGETPIDTLHTIVRLSNNSQFSLSPSTDLTPSAYTAGSMGLVASSKAVHITWEEYTDTTWRIYYRRGRFLNTNAGFSLNQSSIEFDSTTVDYPNYDTISVFNSGIDTLVIGTAMTLDTVNYSVTPPVALIPPGEEAPFLVTFNPQSDGSMSTKLVFYHNGQQSPDCIGVSGEALWREASINYVPSTWNMISSPLIPGPKQSLPLLYSFRNGSYTKEDSLVGGKGYWAKPGDSLVTYVGKGRTSFDFPVARGWNLIGTLTEPVPVATITTTPDSILSSGCYGYTGDAYLVTDTLQPGRSYWVKVKENGIIRLSNE